MPVFDTNQVLILATINNLESFQRPEASRTCYPFHIQVSESPKCDGELEAEHFFFSDGGTKMVGDDGGGGEGESS